MNDSGTRSTDPLLVAESLHKTYRLGDVEVPVLKGASLEVAAGEWVAILGSSGSGKSTLLHLLGGLDRPDPGAGRIVFDGGDISLQNRRERNIYRNRSIGFVFQFYHLLPELTVSENALLPTMVASSIPGARERARELLERFGLGHRLEHRPRELSGGERQRVAIARALANGPQVLLADEPTGNLDEGTGRGILDLLAQEHAEGLGIVMVTHDPSIAELADRVVELHHGQVMQTDPVSR
tara:strand:- start:10801 stop:11517 length:717 start_codon:yes stop_codon:yes gene_type:complete